MASPPLYSTFSAITELLVTGVVFWFFYQALRHANYRWGIMAAALAYETLFNITYMVSRLFTHEEGVTHEHASWVTWYIAAHGTLSLVMFIALVWFVIWAWRRTRKGDLDPIGAHRNWAYTFLVLWTISILSGEAIYAFYFFDIIQ